MLDLLKVARSQLVRGLDHGPIDQVPKGFLQVAGQRRMTGPRHMQKSNGRRQTHLPNHQHQIAVQERKTDIQQDIRGIARPRCDTAIEAKITMQVFADAGVPGRRGRAFVAQ